MRLFERMLMRRHDQRQFSDLKPRVRQRLRLAALELGDAEEAIAAALGLPEPPRLLMVDEEAAVVVLPSERSLFS
jgi:hypothetical protein